MLKSAVLLFIKVDSIAMKRSQNHQFLFTVIIHIKQQGITGCCVQKHPDFPGSIRCIWRDKLINTVIAGNHTGVLSVFLDPIVTMVFAHIVFDHLHLQLMFLMKAAKILRKDSCKHTARR